jgi:hypothetical protein
LKSCSLRRDSLDLEVLQAHTFASASFLAWPSMTRFGALSNKKKLSSFCCFWRFNTTALSQFFWWAFQFAPIKHQHSKEQVGLCALRGLWFVWCVVLVLAAIIAVLFLKKI